MAPFILLALLAGVFVLACVRPAVSLGLVLGAPVFFRIDGAGVHLGNSVFEPSPGVTLPLSAFAAPLFVGFLLGPPFHTRMRWTSLDKLVLAFLGWSVFVFGCAVILGRDPSPLVLAQVVAPVWFYLLGRQLADRDSVRDVIRAFTTVVLTLTLALALSSFFVSHDPAYGSRLGDRLLGGFAVYQAYDYFPIVIVLSVMMLCGGLLITRRRNLYAAAGLFLIAVLLSLYSRAAIVTLIIALATFGILHRHWLARRLLGGAAVAIVVAVVSSAALGIASTQRLFETLDWESERVAASNQTRVGAMREAARTVGANPVLGRAFRPSTHDPGRDVDKTINAHNQYLDYAVRGGVPLSALFVAIAVVSIRHGRRLLSSREKASIYGGVLAALTAVTVAANLTQVNFIQPLTAFPLWLIAGTLCAGTSGPLLMSAPRPLPTRSPSTK